MLQTHQRAVPSAARWNTRNMNFLSGGTAFPTIADMETVQRSCGSHVCGVSFRTGFTSWSSPQQIIGGLQITVFRGNMFPVPVKELPCHSLWSTWFLKHPFVIYQYGIYTVYTCIYCTNIDHEENNNHLNEDFISRNLHILHLEITQHFTNWKLVCA